MNVQLTTQIAEGLPRRRFTVADCFAMVEAGIIGHDERFELIGGEIVPMSPKGIRHEIIKQWLINTLVKNLPNEFNTITETSFYLDHDTFIEPDFVIYPAGNLENLSPETCLLAIEIGASSLAYDLGRKAQLYSQFGIRELWVIDAESHETHIHRQPSADGYQAVTMLKKGQDLAPLALADFALNLGDIS